MAGGVDIVAKTKKKEVDQRLALKFYYRAADMALKQADIYRREGNLIELYVLLVRFISLVVETIPQHKEFNSPAYFVEQREFKAKARSILAELEEIKAEVQRLNKESGWGHRANEADQVKQPGVERAYEFQGPLDVGAPAPTWNLASTQAEPWDVGFPSMAVTMPSSYSTPSATTSDFLTGPMDLLSGPVVSQSASWGSAASAANVTNGFQNITLDPSFNIRPPSAESLSRHSIFMPRGDTRSRPVQSSWVAYPTSQIDDRPVSFPSLEPPPATPPTTTAKPSDDLVSWDAPAPPPSALDVAPDVRLIRQPSPPPMETPVQTIPQQPQIRPEDVADPRPGPPPVVTTGTEDKLEESKGPKPMHISTRMMEEFMRRVSANTQRNLETCGVLAGVLKQGVFSVSTLILPKQQATSDSCSTLNEEEIFDAQDKRGLFQLGWIHTHPSQSCFMSSIDLHTHYSYQVMLQEAVAIVMAPSDHSKKFGVFRLADPGGMKVLRGCNRSGFHPHEAPPDGGVIYQHSSHVFMNPNLKFDVIDLR
eukprot:TRINITY_DN7423_c0_g1_i1.p1 TRINITY_DN7423_c0_g1~~TRINITY_DN7423_c0_g1_i1.p1  ORF type:complete len:536 (-),score=65.39 TRINITY_DN7423_c0_g1_i1:206-1813(-)